MIRLAMLVAMFIAAQVLFLNHAQAEELQLQLCSKWVSEGSAVTTFTCSKNGKSYATGLSLCTTEKSQSTVEDMIANIQVTRLFCKPEWSKDAFDCSHDQDPELAACAEEFHGSMASN